MIAFTKEFLRRTGQACIPMAKPARTTIVYGCGSEKIDARLDANGRIEHLLVYTRTRPQTRGRRRFFIG